ncbi:MAG: fused MFS/spermidine synthase [Propionibacteriaceae bacterium]|jgi:spermidine synthase|nr:fused MFS/spermidine synthase [Propionibacteriaceae bacterium]
MTDPRLVPDHERPGSWMVRVDGTDQSYVDPYDPTYLEFDYVQRVADVIDTAFPVGQRIRAVHVGGAGMTLPRYIAHTRATSAQIVFEPDESLTAAVREVAPLPKHSGIKVRPSDGVAGVMALGDDYVDLVIVDAFVGARVPAALGEVTWFAQVRRVIGAAGVMIMNLTDQAPFHYARRVVAGIAGQFAPVVVGAEPSTLKGRRFGNLVVAAGQSVSGAALVRRAAAAYFPYRILDDLELDRWLGGARPFTADDAEASPMPLDGPTTFR